MDACSAAHAPQSCNGRTTLTIKHILIGALLASTTMAPVMAQDNTDITVVLSEELDLVEPCMATRSNIGRVLLQNINETLVETDFNISEAARRLGRHRRTLARKLEKRPVR